MVRSGTPYVVPVTGDGASSHELPVTRLLSPVAVRYSALSK